VRGRLNPDRSRISTVAAASWRESPRSQARASFSRRRRTGCEEVLGVRWDGPRPVRTASYLPGEPDPPFTKTRSVSYCRFLPRPCRISGALSIGGPPHPALFQGPVGRSLPQVQPGPASGCRGDWPGIPNRLVDRFGLLDRPLWARRPDRMRRNRSPRNFRSCQALDFRRHGQPRLIPDPMNPPIDTHECRARLGSARISGLSVCSAKGVHFHRSTPSRLTALFSLSPAIEGHAPVAVRTRYLGLEHAPAPHHACRRTIVSRPVRVPLLDVSALV